MRYSFALIAFCCGLAGAVQAAPSDDAMLRCASLTDQQARLACYDTLVPPTLPATRPANLAPYDSAQSRPAPPSQKRGWFSGLFGSHSRTPTYRLTARVTDYSVMPFSHVFTISLDNGQVWRQEQGDTTTAALTKPPRDYIVTIEPGALGSYNMRIRDVGGAFKVHRIK